MALRILNSNGVECDPCKKCANKIFFMSMLFFMAPVEHHYDEVIVLHLLRLVVNLNNRGKRCIATPESSAKSKRAASREI
jgi:hypothetical protein